MFNLEIIAGTTNVSVPFHVMDAADGSDEQSWTFEETGIAFWYRRENGLVVAITEATQTANGAHSDGGIVHLDDGRGRLDLPDAACAIGSDSAKFVEYGGHIDDMLVTGGLVQLVNPVLAIGDPITIGATDNDLTHLHLDGLTFGNDELNGELIIVYDVSADEHHITRITDWVLSTELATVETLPFTPEASTDIVWRTGIRFSATTISAFQNGLAVPGSAMALEDDAITAGKFDESTAFPLTSADTDIQQIADDLKNGGRLDLLIDAIKVVTDALTSAAAAKLALSAAGIITGAAVTGTLSATVATTDLTGFANDQLIGRILVVTSGDAEGEATDITDYASSGGTLTFTALTTAMGNGDTFAVV
jgi:hypothetical protein